MPNIKGIENTKKTEVSKHNIIWWVENHIIEPLGYDILLLLLLLHTYRHCITKATSMIMTYHDHIVLW